MLRLLVLLSAASLAVGDRPFDGQTIGVFPVKIENFPSQLALQINGRHKCGATIISETLAVTAAHCCTGVSIRDMELRAGSSYLETDGTVYKVARKVLHRQYDPSTLDFDIALLTVSSPFVMSSRVSPIALPEQGEDVESGTLAMATGWPKSSSTGTKAHQLQALSVPVWSQFDCQRAYDDDEISPRMICAGYRRSGKNSCQADPGGPLVLDNKLIGIVSWGHDCTKPNRPGVYTRVATLRNWIVQGGSGGSIAKFSIALQLALICFHLLFN